MVNSPRLTRVVKVWKSQSENGLQWARLSRSTVEEALGNKPLITGLLLRDTVTGRRDGDAIQWGGAVQVGVSLRSGEEF